MTLRPSLLLLGVLFSPVLWATSALAPAYAADPDILPAPTYAPDTNRYVLVGVTHHSRPPWEIDRDALRKPDQVLTFAKVWPGTVAVDLAPSDGYYSRILSKAVGPRGKVWAVLPPIANIRGARSLQREGKGPAETPKDHTEQCVFGCYATGQPPRVLPVDHLLAVENLREEYPNFRVISESFSYGMSLPDQIDNVVSVDTYHGLHTKIAAPVPESVPGRVQEARSFDAVKFHKTVFLSMNPGALMTIVDYAAAPGAGISVVDSLHRIDPETVKQEVIAAGFVLDGESKVLANPKDDHTRSTDDVYAVRDAMDQFILRFKKPDNASGATMRPNPTQEMERFGNYMDNTHVLRADNKALEPNGDRIRWHYYNSDHTFQEFGRVTDGVAPMQSGIWFWDAQGNHCLLREFPWDERGGAGCNDYYSHRDFNVLSDQYPGQNVPNNEKMTVLPGRVRVK